MLNWFVAGRRLLTAASIVLVALLLAGCGSDGEGSGAATGQTSASTTTQTSEPVEGTLTFWSSLTATSERAWWNRLIKRFERRYPGARVEFTTYSTEEYFTKLLAAFSSGDEPGVFVADAGEELDKFVRTGKVAPLNDMVDLSHFKPAAVKPLTGPGGEIHGIPLAWYILLLWENEDVLAEHGVASPRTWDELLTACGTLSSEGVTPIALGDGGQDQWTAAHLLGTLLYQYGGAGIAANATHGTDGASWTDPAFVDAAARLRQLIDADCFPKGFTGMNYAQMSAQFLQQKAAMIFTGAWLTSEYESSGERFAIGTAPLPDGPDAVNSTEALDGIVGGVFGLAATTKAVDDNPALVKAFLDEAGAAVDDFANANARLSVAVEPNPTGGPLQAQLTRMLNTVGELAAVPDVTLPAAVLDDYYQNVQALTAGELSPEEFAQAMEDASETERPNLPKPAE
ncbi:extracellular solute-binding protein [Conexibacter stalactiti]|uniref:Extracellular solute-binding protein n=1 Tax=Conexibacter stalactiti TaxID=1940611 RepID=A0ABU4HPW4_9ACTN|nr:extracellular solute-binding protein [Conexibacter stalactiti]MDW5594094.1 extracellular solute-binding protein [Conexibacter stalactiti]MEC5034736.1 extracellular solute-binding protein [Conexibacter stalactiti]